jgi:hypothetical protein
MCGLSITAHSIASAPTSYFAWWPVKWSVISASAWLSVLRPLSSCSPPIGEPHTGFGDAPTLAWRLVPYGPAAQYRPHSVSSTTENCSSCRYRDATRDPPRENDLGQQPRHDSALRRTPAGMRHRNFLHDSCLEPSSDQPRHCPTSEEPAWPGLAVLVIGVEGAQITMTWKLNWLQASHFFANSWFTYRTGNSCRD